MNSILCPNDNTEMRQVTAESHYGGPVILDQCPTCGGIWFDQFELYSAKTGQAEKIEMLDKEILTRLDQVIESPFRCPHDRTQLIRFSDVNFPKEITVARCPACSGFWLNRGEFTKYQKARHNKGTRAKSSEVDLNLQKQIRELVEEYKDGRPPNTLGKLGKFLSSEMDPLTGKPLEPESMSPEAQRTFDTVMNAIMLLVRLFAFRRIGF